MADQASCPDPDCRFSAPLALPCVCPEQSRQGREGYQVWVAPVQPHRVCGLGSDFQELLLGSSLGLAGFLQVLLQLIGLLGPVR